ncbi:MAG: UDP-glucose 4-epimerase GalE [Synechococcales bacterium]|nr:UDP-glucose 4-epimerase GalE [Synechococcales bacterium]
MSRQKVLVTGGAGYIGSHVVQQLGEAGYDIVVYDNCSTGFASAVLYGELIVADLADIDRLYQVFANHRFDAVLHFAASLVAPESITRPLDYYSNNTRNTLNLLRCCSAMGVKQLIFSSTAAVYGEPEENPVHETTETLPINPYGRSKLMSEWVIRDYGAVSDLRYVILRYFNVAGADPRGNLGSMAEDATQLIRVACDTALQRRSQLRIFGTDFPTPDGTAIRDYIHVEDLASAHVAALSYLEQGGESQVLNCGYGDGYSVQEVVEQVKRIAQVDFPVLRTDRRAGDPASVVACVDKIHEVLGWQPRYNDLGSIIQSTLLWEKQRKVKVPQAPRHLSLLAYPPAS